MTWVHKGLRGSVLLILVEMAEKRGSKGVLGCFIWAYFHPRYCGFFRPRHEISPFVLEFSLRTSLIPSFCQWRELSAGSFGQHSCGMRWVQGWMEVKQSLITVHHCDHELQALSVCITKWEWGELHLVGFVCCLFQMNLCDIPRRSRSI